MVFIYIVDYVVVFWFVGFGLLGEKIDYYVGLEMVRCVFGSFFGDGYVGLVVVGVVGFYYLYWVLGVVIIVFFGKR